MIFQREYAVKIWDEIMPLLRTHWEEVAHYKDIPLDPDYWVYRELEVKELLRIYTARTEEGKLVGYSAYFLRMHPHYKSSYQASQDIIYVDPAHRGGVGRQLIKYSDDCLRSEGVQVVYQHVKAAHNFGPLLERLGYELQDLIYSKRLDKEK